MHFTASLLVWVFDAAAVMVFVLLVLRFVLRLPFFRYSRAALLTVRLSDPVIERVRRSTSFRVRSFDTGRLAPLTTLALSWLAFHFISPALYHLRLFLIR